MPTMLCFTHMVSIRMSLLSIVTDLFLVLVTGQLGSEIVEIIGEISRLFGVLRDDVIELQ